MTPSRSPAVFSWNVLVLLAAGAWFGTACSDDSGGGGAGGSSGSSANTAGTNPGTSGSKASGSGGTGNSSGGTGAYLEYGGAPDAATYCKDWYTKCGPDNTLDIKIPVELKNFSDEAGCKPYYEAAGPDCKICLKLHTNYVMKGTWDHCIHGAGESLDPKCGCVGSP